MYNETFQGDDNTNLVSFILLHLPYESVFCSAGLLSDFKKIELKNCLNKKFIELKNIKKKLEKIFIENNFYQKKMPQKNYKKKFH